MPFWLTILIKLALRLGLPALEKTLPANIVAIIETVLSFIHAAPNQAIAAKAVQTHLNTLCASGVACAADVKAS